MSSLPKLHVMPRVDEDIERCLEFVSRQPWGKPADRERDIYLGFERILRAPELNDVGVRRRRFGIELRRQNAAQFVIIYAYIKPDPDSPAGLVSIRAVRHSRVKNIFCGVKEPAVQYLRLGWLLGAQRGVPGRLNK